MIQKFQAYGIFFFTIPSFEGLYFKNIFKLKIFQCIMSSVNLKKIFVQKRSLKELITELALLSNWYKNLINSDNGYT